MIKSLRDLGPIAPIHLADLLDRIHVTRKPDQPGMELANVLPDRGGCVSLRVD